MIILLRNRQCATHLTPTYHRMDGSVVMMPPAYRTYFDKPNYSGAAPPPSALPMPKFLRRSSVAADRDASASIGNNFESTGPSIARALPNEYGFSYITSADKRAAQFTVQRPPIQISANVGISAVNSGQQISEAKLRGRRYTKKKKNDRHPLTPRQGARREWHCGKPIINP